MPEGGAQRFRLGNATDWDSHSGITRKAAGSKPGRIGLSL